MQYVKILIIMYDVIYYWYSEFHLHLCTVMQTCKKIVVYFSKKIRCRT